MKVKLSAILLSLFAFSVPLYATSSAVSSSTLVQSTISKIDLNKANVAILTGSFKGIGKKKAEAIIAYRESHKGFKSIEELAEVKGLGQHFVEVNRDKLKETYEIG